MRSFILKAVLIIILLGRFVEPSKAHDIDISACIYNPEETQTVECVLVRNSVRWKEIESVLDAMHSVESVEELDQLQQNCKEKHHKSVCDIIQEKREILIHMHNLQ